MSRQRIDDWDPTTALRSPDRWTNGRKAKIIDAITEGRLSRDWAIRRYAIGEEELQRWEQLYNSFGHHGLRATKLQNYRPPSKRTKK